MKLIISILFVILTFFSCVNRSPDYELPQGENLIPAEKLEQILYDIHVADAILNIGLFEIEDKTPYADTIFYDAVYKKHSCTKEQISQTLLYYMHNDIEALDDIYDRVLNRFIVEEENN